jgi:hypothetical protein
VAADFTIKANDRLPSIQATLNADLTTATGVNFIMKATQGNTIKVNAAAVIVSSAALPTGSVVRYDWLAVDTATPGSYQAEWQVTWTGGKKQTFPTLTYHTVDVLADLDGA